MANPVSLLLIAIVFLVLAVNVYFRIKILKQFNFLKRKNISVDTKKLMNRKTREAYIESEHPEFAKELKTISKDLRNLLIFVITSFFVILLGYLFVHLNS